MCKQSEQFKEKILHLKVIKKKKKCSSKACLKKAISQGILPYGNYYQKGLRNTENSVSCPFKDKRNWDRVAARLTTIVTQSDIQTTSITTNIRQLLHNKLLSLHTKRQHKRLSVTVDGKPFTFMSPA